MPISSRRSSEATNSGLHAFPGAWVHLEAAIDARCDSPCTQAPLPSPSDRCELLLLLGVLDQVAAVALLELSVTVRGAVAEGSSPAAASALAADGVECETGALELDENVQRFDLSSHDAGKLRMREIKETEREIAAEVSAQIGQKMLGRPSGGDAEVARRLGISRQEIQRTRQHVETADEFPVFQGQGWKRSQVLAARAIRVRRSDGQLGVHMGVYAKPH